MKLRAGCWRTRYTPAIPRPPSIRRRWAVNARSTFAAREGHPLTLKAGETCFAVNTGHPMPEGYDAVIMIEQVVLDGDGVTIEAPAFPWQHVRRIGEDIVG